MVVDSGRFVYLARKGAGRLVETVYVGLTTETLSMNLEIMHQQSCIQFTPRANTIIYLLLGFRFCCAILVLLYFVFLNCIFLYVHICIVCYPCGVTINDDDDDDDLRRKVGIFARSVYRSTATRPQCRTRHRPAYAATLPRPVCESSFWT